MKIPSLYPKNIPAILCTTEWRLERLPLGLLTKNSTQSTSVLPFCHIRAYWKRTAREPETVPPPDSQASAGLSQRQVPVFVPVPVSRCHTEARRHCFRANAGGQGFSLSLSLSLGLFLCRPHGPAKGGEPGESRKAKLQTKPANA